MLKLLVLRMAKLVELLLNVQIKCNSRDFFDFSIDDILRQLAKINDWCYFIRLTSQVRQ